MRIRGFLGILPPVLCLLSTGCASNQQQETGKSGKKGGGDVPVTIAKVAQRDVPVEIQVIGNVEAYTIITIRAQVGGQLVKVGFTEGDYIKKGDLLFQIDPRPYEAALQQTQANLERDKANLAQSRAMLQRDMSQQEYNTTQATRYAQLAKEGVLSKEQSDQVRTTANIGVHSVDADKAAISSLTAQMSATEAAIETAKVTLGYTKIYAPIDGRTGNLLTKQGSVIQANSQDLVTINAVQPIYVTFSVPEAQLGNVKKYMALGKLQVSAQPQDDPAGKEIGTLTFIDNSVDTTTGTIKLKGTFPNVQRKLWPGEFVRVTLKLTTMQNALVVPNQAIQTGQDGQFVFVVNDKMTVASRPVTTTLRIDQDIVIASGLQSGETVVTEGQLRLAPNSKVVVRDRPGGKSGPRPGMASGGGQTGSAAPQDSPNRDASGPGDPASGKKRGPKTQ